MRVLVCGDRNYADYMRVFNVLAGLKGEHGTLTVIEGGADGADWQAKQAARELSLSHEEFKADWKKYGRAAGPIRNRAMLDTKPDLLIAFHDNLEASRGTKDCVREAERRGIPVRVVTAAPASEAEGRGDP